MDQSGNLGNPSHYDVNDGSVAASVWSKSGGGDAVNWYFVLPNVMIIRDGIAYYGLLIKMSHGTAISWDGRLIRHCTSVTNLDSFTNVFGTFWAAKYKTVHRVLLDNIGIV